MDTIPNLVEIIGVIGTMLAAMWAMFKSLQSSFLAHLNKNEERMGELITTKNGHLERIAKDFNQTVKEFAQGQATLIEKIDSIDKRV